MDATQRRFWDKVIVTPSTCWEWDGCHDDDGYSMFIFPGGQRAHRYAYELMRGPIPDGLSINHLCRNRGCVNPDHLEPVT